jgi:hypothetical protein
VPLAHYTLRIALSRLPDSIPKRESSGCPFRTLALPVGGSGSRFSGAGFQRHSAGTTKQRRYTSPASALPLLKPRLPAARSGAGTPILPHPSTAHQVFLSLRQGRPPESEKGENFSPFSGHHATSRYVASLHGVSDRTAGVAMFATPEKGDNLSPFSGRQGFATVANVRE